MFILLQTVIHFVTHTKPFFFFFLKKEIGVILGSGATVMTVEEYGRTYFGGKFEYSRRFSNIGIIVGFIVAYEIFKYLGLRYLKWVKR